MDLLPTFPQRRHPPQAHTFSPVGASGCSKPLVLPQGLLKPIGLFIAS